MQATKSKENKVIKVTTINIRGSHTSFTPFSIFKEWRSGTLALAFHSLQRPYHLKTENDHSSPPKVKNGHEENFFEEFFTSLSPLMPCSLKLLGENHSEH